MQKIVYFDKYAPYHLVEGEDGVMVEQRLKMIDFFEAISKAEIGNTLQRINGERYRFHVCRYDKNDQCWEIQILHLRDVILPGVADEAGAYEELDLPEGRFLAESCTVLYDARSHYLFMQRNKTCITMSRLTDYFRALFPDGTLICFKHVLTADQERPWGNRTVFRKVELCCYANQVDRVPVGSSLHKLLKGYGDYQGHTIEVSISMGHKRGSLKHQETKELIEQAYQTPDMLKLNVSAAESEDADFQLLNLLENHVSYRCSLDYERGTRITHTMLYHACLRAHKQAGN